MMSNSVTPPSGLDALVSALESESAARTALASAEKQADGLIRAARADGVSWAALAEVTGLDARRLQYRLERHDPAEVMRWEERRVPEAEKVERAGVPQHGQSAPAGTVTITEAARRLDKARLTVYRMIERGELETVEHAGRPRVTEESLGEVANAAADTISISEAARRLNIARQTVRSWVADGSLAAHPDDPTRIMESDVNARLAASDTSLVSLSDAAEMLGISRMQAYRLADRGILDEVTAPSGRRAVTRASVVAEMERRAE